MAVLTGGTVIGAGCYRDGAGLKLSITIEVPYAPGQIAVAGNSGEPDSVMPRTPTNLIGRAVTVTTSAGAEVAAGGIAIT